MDGECDRMSGTPYAEIARPTAGPVPDSSTYEGLLQLKKAYDTTFSDMTAALRSLWGPELPYEVCTEDLGTLLDAMHYGWVRDTIQLAASERLTDDALPPPTLDVRAHECGLLVSRALQAALYKRNAWNQLLGAEVVSTLDPASRGLLRWVGVPQQGGYSHVMAAVEWRIPPAMRVAAREESAAASPFFNGVAHGEHLFTSALSDASTLEEAKDIQLVQAPPWSELGRAIPTPKRLNTAQAILTSLPYYFLAQIPFKALGDVCTLSIPVVLGSFVNYLNHQDDATWGRGLSLVFVLFVLQIVQSCSLHRFYFVSIKGGLQYRSAVTACIFEKCFTISNKALSRPEMNTGRLINMVSIDVERVNDFMQFCMYLWSSPMVFLVSIILLARLVGWCAIMAVIAMLVTLPINAQLTKWQMASRKKLVKATDQRVKATNEFFSGIRIAKFMTWESRFIANIEAKRAVEMHYIKQVQVARVFMSFINIATPMVMIALVFIVYHALGHELTPAVVFPTISLLGILRMPFMMIPFVFQTTVQFVVSIRRINAFLECDSASFSHIEDIEDFYQGQSSSHSALCQAAAVLEHADITAFVPVKLPLGPSFKLRFLARFARRYCCEVCRPVRRKAPLVFAAEDAAMPSENFSETTRNTKGAGEGNGKSTAKPIMQVEEYFELEPKVLLRDLSLSIPTGKLTIVLGATGSGKSTLLQALLAQFEVTRGRVWVTQNVAYVPQQPWIMNATVRENILFFGEEDAERLSEAIRVSQLATDLTLLGSGLETEIGEKGVNLSGGQKARVSLARAVYADRDMYLMDDPLSALDAHVGNRVVTECVLGCLAGKTRVLATHQLHVVLRADHVVVIEAGALAFDGPRDEFMQSSLYHTMAESASHHEEEGSDEATEVAGKREAAGTEEGNEEHVATEDADKSIATQLMTVEEKAIGGVPFMTYLDYFEFCGGRHIAAIVLAIFVVTELLTVSSTVWLSMWSTDRFHLTVNSYLTWYIVLVICGTISTPLRFSMCYNAMRTGALKMHAVMLRSVSRGTMEFFDTTPLGRLLNRFSRDIDVADNNLQLSMIQLLNCFMSICSSVLITMVSQPLVILALLPGGFLYYKLMVFYNAANREVRRTSSLVKSPLFSLLGEVLSGVLTISAFGRTDVVMREALTRLDLVFSCSQLENTANRWLGVRVEFLSNVIVTCIAFAGVLGIMTGITGKDIGLVSLSLTMALQTTSQLNWLVRQAASVEADMNSVERVIHYAKNTPMEDMPELDNEIDQQQSYTRLETTVDGAEMVTIEMGSPAQAAPHVVRAGSLEFHGVQMRYRDGLPLVLRDVSFTVQPREKVGIVGRTGSGKSTLLLTFMRMVDICGGEIVVSGRPIRSYGLRELRRQFSMIPQDPVLFDGTVRLNVDPFLEASSEEVWAALELVGLRERIASEPEGIDGRVLEGGSNFSVGQRQLLCMARALLKKGNGFILMDEATANIDQSLDRHIQTTVMKAFGEYTVITIAHRLQTVATYDKIIVMDRGVVAEMGSPGELVGDRNSLFHGMVDAMGSAAARAFRTVVLGGVAEVGGSSSPRG